MATLETTSSRAQFTLKLGVTDDEVDTGSFSISDLNEDVTADILEGMLEVIEPLLNYSVYTVKRYTTETLVSSDEE